MFIRRALLAAVFATLLTGAAAAQPSGSDASREQQRLTSADSYVPLPTLSAGVIAQGRAAGTLVVDVGIDSPNAALRARAQSLRPRLMDALRTALSTYASTYYRDRTAPDPETLARLMQNAVDRTLGAQGARLLLSNVIYQRRSGAA